MSLWAYARQDTTINIVLQRQLSYTDEFDITDVLFTAPRFAECLTFELCAEAFGSVEVLEQRSPLLGYGVVILDRPPRPCLSKDAFGAIF
jgi:hypothetical protein